jgi:acyl carrier protein
VTFSFSRLTLFLNFLILSHHSVDLIAIFQNLENEFKKKYDKKLAVPSEKLGSVKKFGDLMNVVYEAFHSTEGK